MYMEILLMHVALMVSKILTQMCQINCPWQKNQWKKYVVMTMISINDLIEYVR